MTKDLGIATAYGYARSKGYTGTEEEFATLMASYGTVAGAAAESAAEAAQHMEDARTAATNASNSAAAALDSETAARQSAAAAEDARENAAASERAATSRAGEAAASATTAEEAKTAALQAQEDASASASTAGVSATAASDSATAASGSATAAAASAAEAAHSAETLTVDTTLSVSGRAADAKTVGDKIAEIEELSGLRRYGVSGIGQAAAALTRLWDSVGMTAQVGTDGDNSSVINNFDDATPFNRRKCVGEWVKDGGRAVFHVHSYQGDEGYAEDGTKGDYVAVECPRAYYYFHDGILGVSAHQYPEWRPFDIFCRSHNPEDTMPYVYLPAYALTLDASGHAVCLPGYDNEQGCYKDMLDAARTYKNGELGNLAVLQPATVSFYEWALFTVEFATQDAQTIMQGASALRHNADDRAVFTDLTHAITNNYQAGRVAGEYVCISDPAEDINLKTRQATHKITAITRCDENGYADAAGTHQLLELEDLGKAYISYTVGTEYGLRSRPYRTGACNGVSTSSGSPVSNSDGYHPMKYRWRENVFGNQYKTLVDLFNVRVGTSDDDYSLDWYYLTHPEEYAPSSTSKPEATDLAGDDFELLDIRTEHENYVNGYIKSKIFSERYPDIGIPEKTTGGSATTFWADNASLVNSVVVRAVRSGGYWSSGRYDGFSSVSAAYAPSHSPASFGGDLCFIQ